MLIPYILLIYLILGMKDFCSPGQMEIGIRSGQPMETSI